MKKKKRSLRSVLKKKLHPLLSYAVMIGVGAIAVSATGTKIETNIVAPIDNVSIVRNEVNPPAPADLAKLKESATEFAFQLSTIKSQVAELERYGRVPPAALMDAIGRGEQLVGIIEQAQTLADIGELNPANKLRSIGAAIAANSKF